MLTRNKYMRRDVPPFFRETYLGNYFVHSDGLNCEFVSVNKQGDRCHDAISKAINQREIVITVITMGNTIGL